MPDRNYLNQSPLFWLGIFSGCSPFWQGRHGGGNDHLPRWEHVVERCSFHITEDGKQRKQPEKTGKLQSSKPPLSVTYLKPPGPAS